MANEKHEITGAALYSDGGSGGHIEFTFGNGGKATVAASIDRQPLPEEERPVPTLAAFHGDEEAREQAEERERIALEASKETGPVVAHTGANEAVKPTSEEV